MSTNDSVQKRTKKMASLLFKKKNHLKSVYPPKKNSLPGFAPTPCNC